MVRGRYWSTSEVDKMRWLKLWHNFNQCETMGSLFRSLSCETSLALQKRFPHRLRSSASSFNVQYPILSLTLSSSCLRLLFHRSVISILSSIFLSITCFIKQFLRKMWPTHWGFPLFTVRKILFCSSTLCNTSWFFTRSVQLIFAIILQDHILNFQVFLFSSTFRSVQFSAPQSAMLQI